MPRSPRCAGAEARRPPGGLGRRLVDRLLALAAPGRMERVLAAWDEHLVHPTLPRTACGATAIRSGSNGWRWRRMRSPPPSSTPRPGGSLPLVIEPFVSGRAGVSEEEAAEWVAELATSASASSSSRACSSASVPPGRLARSVARRLALLAVVGHYRISVGVSKSDVHPGDLSGYAASRGLDFRGQALQLGYLGAFPGPRS